jgi:hypothetical protein
MKKYQALAGGDCYTKECFRTHMSLNNRLAVLRADPDVRDLEDVGASQCVGFENRSYVASDSWCILFGTPERDGHECLKRHGHG